MEGCGRDRRCSGKGHKRKKLRKPVVPSAASPPPHHLQVLGGDPTLLSGNTGHHLSPATSVLTEPSALRALSPGGFILSVCLASISSLYPHLA